MNNNSEVPTWQGTSLASLLQEITLNWSGVCPRTYAVMFTDLLATNGLPPVQFSETFFSIALRPQLPANAPTTVSTTSNTVASVLETTATAGSKILETTAKSAAKSLEITSSGVARTLEDATASATRSLETSVASMVRSLEGTVATTVSVLVQALSGIPRKVSAPVHQALITDGDDTLESSCIPPSTEKVYSAAYTNTKVKTVNMPANVKSLSTDHTKKSTMKENKKSTNTDHAKTSKMPENIKSTSTDHTKTSKLQVNVKSSSTDITKTSNIHEIGKSKIPAQDAPTSADHVKASNIPERVRFASTSSEEEDNLFKNRKRPAASPVHKKKSQQRTSIITNFLSQSIFLGSKLQVPGKSSSKPILPTIDDNHKENGTIAIRTKPVLPRITSLKSTPRTCKGKLKLIAGANASPLVTPITLKGKLKLAGSKATPLSTHTVSKVQARHNPRLKRLQKPNRPKLTLESPSMFTPW